MSPVSAFDGATFPEPEVRRISDGKLKLTPSLLLEPPLPSIIEVEPHVVVPKSKCNVPPLPPTEESTDIVAPLPGPNNDTPPTLAIDPSRRKGEGTDVTTVRRVHPRPLN